MMNPIRVVSRLSTDVIAVEDDEVAAALRIIEEKARQPIGVGDVVASVALSRRALEIRFQNALGRSIREEIQRVRNIERARVRPPLQRLPRPRLSRTNQGEPVAGQQADHRATATRRSLRIGRDRDEGDKLRNRKRVPFANQSEWDTMNIRTKAA